VDVTFIELRGKGARAALQGVLEQLEGAQGATLLKSKDEAELYLLVCRHRGELRVSYPPKARVWRFSETRPDHETPHEL
jgi:hypothetical protein